MGERNAVNTIRGYFYQFDYTIIKLLELENASDSIVVEGIEDIDITIASEETAIQCKYYEHTEYNHSVIAPAIRLMLAHYKKVIEGTSSPIKYSIYGHYQSGQDKLTLPFNIDFLKKNFLSFKTGKEKHELHEELKLTEANLSTFLENLSIDINALSLDIQKSHLIELLINEFTCSRNDAEILYYSRALAKIRSIAIEQDKIQRRITRTDFIKAVNVKQILFNNWYIVFKGKQKWLSELRSQYFSALNNSPFERFFLIQASPTDYSRSSLKELILILDKKWTKISKRDSQPYCPYLYIHGITKRELINLKKELFEEDFFFIDGYDYMGANFNPKSLVRTANYNNQIRIKFVNCLEDFQEVLNVSQKTKEIYQFYFTEPIFTMNYDNVKYVAIQIQNFSDIKGVI